MVILEIKKEHIQKEKENREGLPFRRLIIGKRRGEDPEEVFN